MRIDDFRYGLVPFESCPISLDVERVNQKRVVAFSVLATLPKALSSSFSPMGTESEHLPRFAIVRWLDAVGNSMVQSFGPELHAERRAQIHHVDDVVWRYEKADFIQVRAVRRSALMTIAKALRA